MKVLLNVVRDGPIRLIHVIPAYLQILRDVDLTIVGAVWGPKSTDEWDEGEPKNAWILVESKGEDLSSEQSDFTDNEISDHVTVNSTENGSLPDGQPIE